MASKRVRIIPIPRDPPDLKRLAKALIKLAQQELEREEMERKNKRKPA